MGCRPEPVGVVSLSLTGRVCSQEFAGHFGMLDPTEK